MGGTCSTYGEMRNVGFHPSCNGVEGLHVDTTRVDGTITLGLGCVLDSAGSR